MRIIFVNTYCGAFGGVEQNIADVVAGLRARGHYCSLVYEQETTKGVGEYKKLFNSTISIQAAGSFSATLQELVKSGTWDAVYVHKLDSVTPLLPLKGTVRLVRMIHDHDECCPRHHKYFTFSGKICTRPVGWRCWTDLAFIERDRESPCGVRWRNLFRHRHELALNRNIFDRFLVGSRFMQTELTMNGFKADRIRRLAPCVQLPDRPTTPVPDSCEILFVGQLIRGKGVDHLLDAVSRLKVPFHLTIAGDGNGRQMLENRAAELGLTDRVNFVGWIPRQELDVLYDHCRVLAVPSRWAEPFGMIGLEAMHRGRPVVGFAVGGIPDWLEDGINGYAVAEGDIQGFANALTTLLSDLALSREMGQRGRDKLEHTFSFHHYLDQLCKILRGEDSSRKKRSI